MLESALNFFKDYGIWGLMIHSFLDAIIFPVPAFFSQVSLSLIDPSSAILLATAGYIACLLGTPVGYLLGVLIGKPLLQFTVKKKWVDKAVDLFQKNGGTAIMIGAFTPIPFKVFTILSGFISYPLWKLILYAALGRAAKFYVVGILFYLYGRAAENMVDEASMYVFAIGVPLIVLGLVIKKLVDKRREKRARDQEAESQKETVQTDMAQRDTAQKEQSVGLRIEESADSLH